MKPVFIHLLLAVVVFASADKALLLDDFTGRDTANKLGWSWYYYSDENNGGNSEIIGAEHKPGGGFSGIIYAAAGDSSDFCGSLEFLLGEPDSVSFYDPFVGIGTDIAVSGSSVNCTGLTAVRFRARSIPPLNIRFEIESAATIHFAHHYAPVSVDSVWNDYTVSIDAMEQPGWINRSECRRIDDVIDSTRKFNWKVFLSDNEYLDDTGCLMIDSIVLIGLDNLPMKVPPVVSCMMPAVNISPSIPAAAAFDLLGRKFTGGTAGYPGIPGTMIRKTVKGSGIRTTLTGGLHPEALPGIKRQ